MLFHSSRLSQRRAVPAATSADDDVTSPSSPRLASFGRIIASPSVAFRLWLPLSRFRLHHRPSSRTLRLSPALSCSLSSSFRGSTPVPLPPPPPSPVGPSPTGTAYSPCAFGSPLRLRGGSPLAPPNFLLAFPCFHFGLPSELSNVQPFNMAMQDRYGLLTNSRSYKTLVTTADLNSLIAFRLQLRDCDRSVVDDRWIGLLRSFLNSTPGLPDLCHSTISSSPSGPSSPPTRALAASSYLLTASTSLKAVLFFSGPDSLADGPAPRISSDSFLHQSPFPQPLSLTLLPYGFSRWMRSRFYGDRALTEPPIIPVTPLDIQDFIVLYNSLGACPEKLMSCCWLLRLAPFFQNGTIRASITPSSATPLGPGSSLAVPSLLPMTTSVTRRPRVTFGPSPPSSSPIDLTASALLSHSPIPFNTSLHPGSSSSSSSSSPPSSSFYSATIPAVSGPLVSGSRGSSSAAVSSNLPLDPFPSPPAGLLT
jgi:hypothetical protein